MPRYILIYWKHSPGKKFELAHTITTTAPLKLKSSEFEILDSIRGIAALYVVIAHCRGVLWLGGAEFMKLFPRNHWGAWDYFIFGSSILTRLAVEFVIVFFVLSGFSIAYSLASNKSPIEFYKRRFLRIYPPYVVALIWAGFVFILTRYWHPEWYDGSITQLAFIRTMEMNNYLDGKVIVKNLLYMPGEGFISPFWSLTYEVMFYILAPFILRKINAYIVVSAVLFLVNIFIPGRLLSLNLPVYIYDFLFNYNIYFAVGVFLFSRYPIISGWFKEYTKFEFLLILGGFLVFMYAANFYLKIENLFTFVEAAMLSSMLIIFFLKYQFRIRWLLGVGKFSYTLYITHFASVYLYLGIYWLIFKPHLYYITSFLVWIPAVFFALVIAYIQYYFVERRTKNILKMLRKKAVAQSAEGISISS